MKKIVCVLLAAMLVVSLAGCNGFYCEYSLECSYDSTNNGFMVSYLAYSGVSPVEQTMHGYNGVMGFSQNDIGGYRMTQSADNRLVMFEDGYWMTDGTDVISKQISICLDTEYTDELLNGAKKSDLDEFSATVTYHMAAPVTMVTGSEYAKVNGNSVTVDVFAMAVDHVSKVTFVSTPGGEIPKYAALQQFSDVDQDAWYAPALNAAVCDGVIAGYGNYRVGPNDGVTFSQLAKILCHWVGNVETERDGIDHWASEYVNKMLDEGVFLEEDVTKNGVLDPGMMDTVMTREQAISAVAIAMQLKDYEARNDVPDIPDGSSIDPNYLETVKLGYALGVTTGVDGDHTFSPKSEVTRAQVCQTLYNVGLIGN